MNKIFLTLAILSLILTVNVAFAENVTVNSNEDIYVSMDGSDSLGDGSVDNPYQSLNYSIHKSYSISNIYLKNGIYNSTGYEIVNKSISITGIGDVVIDAQNSENLFKISEKASLKLTNIKFINGYGSLDGVLSPITNDGNLHINNCNFYNFTTINGAIFNKNSLTIDNVSTSKLNIDWKSVFGEAGNIGFASWIAKQIRENPSRGELVTNNNNCSILNSNILSTVYNNFNMNVFGSYIENFISNRSQDFDIKSIIDSSEIKSLRVVNNTLVIINNSFINHEQSIYSYSNIIIQNSTFSNDTFYSFVASHCNILIKSSSFNGNIKVSYSNMNLTHSTILGTLSTGYDSYVNANYNWWGDNKGPKTFQNSYSTIISNYWLVMVFNMLDDSYFNVEFVKYTDGLNVFDMDNLSDVNIRHVKLETESGKFLNAEGYLENATFKSKLLDNNNNTVVYAKVDNQILRVVVGNLTDYNWYVSDKFGNDYFCDGSYENPYKTLSKANSKAFSGNTIYVMEGIYTLSWNANLQISKNLTFIGLGNSILSRPNARNIFKVDGRGILNLYNFNFTSHTYDSYTNPFIYLNGGEVNIKNSNFYNVSLTSGIIFSDYSDLINLDNVTFKKFIGTAIMGNSSYIKINNTKFLSEGRQYAADYIIKVNSNIDIFNSKFENNKDGLAILYSKGYLYDSIVLRMNNCTIQNNDWSSHAFFGIGEGIVKSFKHLIIENCRFINNYGHVVSCDKIINSTFINNTDVPFEESHPSGGYSYYDQSIIHASELINNSYFYGNSLPSKSYEQCVVHSPNVYNSVFINNKAAYGGALSNPKEVHYCVFINNTGIYGANDVFVYKGNLNASSNWWGSNQKPDKSRIEVFVGDLILENWIIMNVTQNQDKIIVSLNTLLDDNKTFTSLNHELPSREVFFTTDNGILNPESCWLNDNHAFATLIKDTTKDFDVYVIIDNQKLSLTIHNNSTQLLINDVTFYGNNNKYKITLINVNGHKISNQLIQILVTDSKGIKRPYVLTTNSLGVTYLDIDYSVGMYDVEVIYYGNGYFEKSSARAIINVSSISTSIYSHDYTYWGKNNKFSAILTDASGRYLLNQSLLLQVFDLKDKLISIANVMTGTNGRAEALLSLDVGAYKVKWEYMGNEWYGKSSYVSLIAVKPINTTLILPNMTFYGKGNDYEFTFTDIYGNIISDETISLIIFNESDSREFKIVVKDGVGSININLLPGNYKMKAHYGGDDVYGPAISKANLVIQKVLLTFDFKSYSKIPENGVFSIIVKDMYGKRVQGQNLTLDLYCDGLYKTYDAISDANGEVNFKVDAPENIYFAIINFEGSTWYRQATGAATVEISHSVSVGNVYLNASDYVAYYGENNYYTIKFNDTNKFSLEGIKIPVIISSGEFSKAYNIKSDVFGNVRLQITLDPGVYDITYKYENEYYNIHDSKTNKITIYKMPTTLTASDVIVKYGDLQNFEVKLTNKNGVAISNLPVNIYVDDVLFNISTNAFGLAKLPIDFDLGYHNVKCVFDNVNYVSSTANATILVVDDSKIITSIESSECYGQENKLINYSVILQDTLDNPIKSSQIILNLFDIGGEFVNSYDVYTNNNGEAIFNLNLTYGTYQAKTYYVGNNLYFESFNTNYIYVTPLDNVTETILYGSDIEIVNGYDNAYSVILRTINGDFIPNVTVEFVVKGNSYFSTTDENGRAYLIAPLKPGAYEIKAKFPGSKNLTKSYVTNYIQVSGELFYLLSQDVVKSYNNGTHYYVALFDALGHPLSGKIIKFQFGNETFENITDGDGFTCFEIWFEPGKYNITAIYEGDFPDEFISVSNNITVLTTLLSENVTKYYDGSTMIIAAFSNFKDDYLVKTNVFLNINGVTYKIKTDEYGYAVLDINLKAGCYNLTILNTLTGQIGVYSVKIKSTLTAKNLVKYYKNSARFTAIFKDKNGNLLKNIKVKFILKGKTYNVKTNSKGVASLKINLKPGKYYITTLNIKTTEKSTNEIIIKKTIITKNKNVKANKKINFQAKILKNNGKIAKKVIVKFKVNNKTYKLKSNNEGVVKLNIKLKKGTYTIFTSCNGLSVKNKVRCS